ncbi:MAG: UbiD family decarboxylase [Candidatus Bathyarchaeota archaeon]|nr:UbiD family decarboxylase [Candidatus Bathyarchaeota archaeon]MDH5746464.1 UbiD family decarboxylase [Candidatus Bathyarchaeota archaeon]
MSLRNFLAEMHRKGEILEVKEEVSPRFEISSILKEFDGGPILYFDAVKRYDTKIVAGACGTRQRLCWALGVDTENLYQRLISAWQTPTQPKRVRDGPVSEVVEKARLSEIPILTHFERDAGRYITSAILSARSLDGEIENVSIHRLQVLDNRHLAIRLVPRHLFKLWQMAKEYKQDLDVAISIGTHPAVMLAASSPISLGVSEFDVANTLLSNRLRLIKCENVNAYAPADAEIVLEGRISTEKEVVEGPFVDATGTYDVQQKQPVIELINMMYRRDHVYQALLPSGSEHKLLMGLPREAAIWESVSKVVPSVKAINFSIGGCSWLHAIISIDKLVDGDAKNALLAAFSAHPSLKHAVVVDTDIDVFKLNEVEWAIATRFQAGEDLLVIPKARGSTLDPSANQETGLTTKLGLDATRPLTKPKVKFEPAKIPSSKRATKIIHALRKSPLNETVVRGL